MVLKDLFAQLQQAPESVEFDDVIGVIDSNYTFTPAAFSNGDTRNEAGQNNGSCKIFAFAQLQQLSEQQTLHCFGKYYRDDVLGNPNGDDHQNIRCFMKTGWAGIDFQSNALG